MISMFEDVAKAAIIDPNSKMNRKKRKVFYQRLILIVTGPIYCYSLSN